MNQRLVLPSLLLATMAAHAQDTSPTSAPAETAKLEEVVVTAQKREERLQDVPVAVTAFAGRS
jgi:iron complex outermembrane receptor protein